MTPVIVDAENISKTYRLGSERSNWRALVPGPLGEVHNGPSFEALSNVSLQIRAGESVGIMGANGAGKSTLLKVLAGVVRPTSGRVQINGRVASAIELGVGFDPNLTGSENLRFAAYLFGASPKEVDANYDAIVDFAELADFMDMPVKRYSTGMRARLGFSIVTSFRSDVMILDEVLSVGDWKFQTRCLERINDLREAGAAIVAVSHSHWLISQICDSAILLDSGRVVAEGDPLSVIEKYLGEETITDPEKDAAFPVLPKLKKIEEQPVVRISDLRIEPKAIQPNDRLHLRFVLEVDKEVDAELVMSIYTMGRAVFADPEVGPSELLRQPGRWEVSCTTDQLPFSAGTFKVRIAVVVQTDPDDIMQEYVGALATASESFQVLGVVSSRPGLLFETTWSSERAVSDRRDPEPEPASDPD